MTTKKFGFLLACCFTILLAFKPQDKPTIYLIGDSTVRNNDKAQWGWGSLLPSFFDSSKVAIKNHAMAGRSTRTFVKEQRWEKVLNNLKSGDYVLMQFGHNDGSKPDTSKAGYRGVLRGTGEETVNLTWKDGTVETVHTHGYYLRKFIKESKAKGAIPIVLSMIPRNQWVDGKVKRVDKDFGLWAKTVAQEEGVTFIDLNAITADKYDALGPDKVKDFFAGDHTHTNKEGARINAQAIVEGIKASSEKRLKKLLSKS
jgi:lysophospholipase L1-like esterase